MSSEVTLNLVAIALQKLEAIQANESEPISDAECHKRAAEVAEAALQAIAVSTKLLLSTNAEARITGLGAFYLEENQIRFIPEPDVLQYALLKQHSTDQIELSVRNAFVSALSVAQKLIPLLGIQSEELATTTAPVSSDLVEKIFTGGVSNNFARSVSSIINDIVARLNQVGIDIELRQFERSSAMEEQPQVLWSVNGSWGPAEPATQSGVESQQSGIVIPEKSGG